MKNRKVLFRASYFRMDNTGVTIEGKDLNLNISIMVICHKKRFTLKHLKDFGFGRVGLEGVIQGEVNIFLLFE